MPTFEQTRASYRALWDGMIVEKKAAADAAARRILAGKPRYQAVEKQTGVPWFFIGLCHLREGNLSFETYLGNGQSIRRVTTIVPKGRGPFPDFESGARDALQKQGLTAIHDWSLERIAYCLEGFNGFGYRAHGVHSPYLWAGTNRYTRGKYISDGVFDANAVDSQLGSMAVLASLAALDADVARFIGIAKLAAAPANENAPAPVTPIALPAPAEQPAAKQTGKHDGIAATIIAAILAAAASAYTWAQHHLPGIFIGVVALVVLALVAFRLMKGHWPWTHNSTGDRSPGLLPLSLPNSAAFSEMHSRHLEELSDRLQALHSLAPSAPTPRRKRSDARSPRTRRPPRKSKSSKPSARKNSSSKRKSRSKR